VFGNYSHFNKLMKGYLVSPFSVSYTRHQFKAAFNDDVPLASLGGDELSVAECPFAVPFTAPFAGSGTSAAICWFISEFGDL
jgi:hypothetical protein